MAAETCGMPGAKISGEIIQPGQQRNGKAANESAAAEIGGGYQRK